MVLKKVISGGQTGVDQAALDAAIALGIDHGGYCPRGRKSEDGKIPKKYTLLEVESDEYAVRTKLNITYSDATWVLLHGSIKDVADGTVLTVDELEKSQKPYLILDISKPAEKSWLQDWIKQHEIKILNIAGPRESSCPGVGERAYSYFLDCFATL